MYYSTKSLLRDNMLVKLPRDADVIKSPGTFIITYENGRFRYAGKRIHTSARFPAYAIRSGIQHCRYGIARVGVYYLPNYPGHPFHLGMNGEIHFTFAHSIGLQRLLEHAGWPDHLNASDILELLREHITIAVGTAVTRFCGSRTWDYLQMTDNPQALTAACWNELFMLFFEYGLLLFPQQFIIRPSKPVIMSST